jgi:uncharacterized protein YybS (DUF2232 family)
VGGGGRAHGVVEGALLAALGVALVLATAYLPLLGTVAVLAWPLPTVAAYVRHGPRTAVLVAAVAGLLLALLQGPPVGLGAAVFMAALGCSLGWGIAGGRDAQLTVALAALAAVGVMAFSFATSLLFFRENVFAELLAALGTAIDQAGALYARAGLPPAQVAAIRQALDGMRTMILQVWPVGLALGAVLLGLGCYLAAAALLRRLGRTAPPLPAFASWRAPWPAIGGWLAGAVLLLLRGAPGWLHLVGLNLYYGFSLLFLVDGLALLYAVLRHVRASRGLAVAVCALAALNGLFYTLLVWAGLFDALFGYRRLLGARP